MKIGTGFKLTFLPKGDIQVSVRHIKRYLDVTNHQRNPSQTTMTSVLPLQTQKTGVGQEAEEGEFQPISEDKVIYFPWKVEMTQKVKQN